MIEDSQTKFSKRFMDFNQKSIEIQMFLNPFNININNISNQLQMEILELQHNETLNTAFSVENIQQFYYRLQNILRN